MSPSLAMRAFSSLPVVLAVVAACGGALAPTPAASAPSAQGPSSSSPALRAITAPELCVSAGRVTAAGATSRLRVDSGGMRAVLAGDDSAVAELDFTYRGPSAQTTPLANGEVRRQIGLKLRAADTCNLVYVMWHAAPTEGLGVSVKVNAGKSTHEECGAHGYLNLRPRSSAPLPRLRPGERHVLRAELDGTTLRVLADGAVVWSGPLPAEAFTFDGPAGVRSDNGVYDFELRVLRPRVAAARCPPPSR